MVAHVPLPGPARNALSVGGHLGVAGEEHRVWPRGRVPAIVLMTVAAILPRVVQDLTVRTTISSGCSATRSPANRYRP